MLHPNAMDKGCRHASSVKKIALKFRLGLTCASARMGARPRWEAFVMRKMTLAVVSAALLSSGAYGQNAASGTPSCKDLEHLELQGARILSAQTVAAGAFTPPSNTNDRATGDLTFYKLLRTFCGLVAEATPSAESSTKIVAWMAATEATDAG